MLRLLALILATVAVQAAETRIAVIPKGTTHEFWKSIHAGARAAAAELTAAGTPVTIVWKGPLKEDDRAGQIEVVENLAASGVAGIVLAPLDDRALVAPVEAAVQSGLPVVVIDSALRSERIRSFVATDNREGGRIAGRHLAGLLGGSGTVLMLRYMEGSASTLEREAGFLEAIKTFPGITVVSQDQYAGPTRDTALTASQNLLTRFGERIQGVFTPNESSTAGMNLALVQEGLTGVRHVGFDASPALVAALRAGTLHGAVVQDPHRMGYLGVKHCAMAIRGEQVPARVDTPVQLVTPGNLEEPAIRALLAPPAEGR
jgi:ribose transport system substrate-binding protein